ncbi:MAG TPA: ATP-dependent endonuclease [Methylophilus sp.]|uniref:ATP-dependent nuclease n=1 Tax=Methylophilus sp. TaxID=29541 RepID=UPI002B8D34DF|nr:ATP-dependent endonuclease [Methylophilus sp.]HSH85711.1 ATP-dependent endonuclease [Methylophilus sp.]
MKIKSVRIKNFRTLKDVTIPFDKVTTFIGPNGAGKSTVLRALDWFFNGKSGSLSGNDCSFGAVDEDIEVRVTFNELTPRDKEALGKYVPTGVETFTALKYRNPAGIEVLSANAKSYPPFNQIRSKGSAGDKKTAYNELRAADSSLKLPAWTSQDAALGTLIAWEAANVELLGDAPDVLETNFFGFNSGGKMNGLFDFVLVTADLRASEESQDGKSSIIGKIIERSINRTAADAKIAEIVAESKLKQQQVYEETFNAQLNVLTNQLNDVISIYSPGRRVTVEPAEIELKAPKTTFNVGILDGNTETAVDRQGHGFQRTLLISALQLLAQSTAADTEGVICLAIEEPELFQHPIQAQAFAKVLRSLAEDESKRIQVTYATHSQYFIEAKYFDQVRRLTRKSGPEGKTNVAVNFSTVEIVKEKLKEIVPPNQVDRQLDGIVAGRLTVGLFAESVLLVEGTTEVAVFHGVGDRESIGFLESNGLAVIDAGCKGGIALAHAILTSIGIPTFALFDGDGGYVDRALALNQPEKVINNERAKIIKENRLLLAYLHEDIVDFPSDKIGKKSATLGDNLETYLETNWTEWVISCKELEDQAGIELKKNNSAYRQATLKAGGNAPELLKQILNKVLER